MNTKTVSVEVFWVPAAMGGRKALPSEKRYVSVSRFGEDDETWKNEAWSIVLDFEEPPMSYDIPTRGKATFLAEDAPQERLQEGKSFEVYEGSRKVAVVKVISVAF